MAIQKRNYGFGQIVGFALPEAVERTKAALKDEGFSVLCEIDVQKTIEDELGVLFRPYVILGVCNPALAHQALSAEIDIGLLLPCNVIVYEVQGGSMVKVEDPKAVLGIAGNPQMEPMANESRDRLIRVLDKVAGQP